MAIEDTLLELSERVHKVFPKIEPPSFDNIIGHDCGECFELRDEFNGKNWWQVDDKAIKANHGQMPLFSHQAYQYYLPGFILNALSDFSDDNLVLEFFIYGWGPSDSLMAHMSERRSKFTSEQLKLIADVLRVVISEPSMETLHEEASKALHFAKAE